MYAPPARPRAMSSSNSDLEDENRRDFKLLSLLRTAPNYGTSLEGSDSHDSGHGQSFASRAASHDGCHHVTARSALIWPLQLTPSFVDHYILGDVIGHGSYAEVRECVDTRTLERCALKIVNKSHLARQAPRALANQLLEIRLLRHLSHPNVIAMRECLFRGDNIYLALEYGAFNLSELLADQPNNLLAVHAARPLFKQLCAAVAYLHSMGVVHRDIKPDNILLTTSGALKLIDFGVSRLLSIWLEHDLCANYEGSPLFQAPEVVAGQREYRGFKVDVWSCGVTLYLMLFGEHPFSDDALLGLYDKILAQELTIPAPGASPALSDLLAWMLEKDHARRATVGQVQASAWCQLTDTSCGSSENGHLEEAQQGGHSDFFELVVRGRQGRASASRNNVHESPQQQQQRDMYRSMSCLPYLYRHHFAHLPLAVAANAREPPGAGRAPGSCTIIERINFMSPNPSPSSARASPASSGAPGAAASEPSSNSNQETDEGDEAREHAENDVQWGTREQYQLMKVPQVRANRIRCGAASKARKRKRDRRLRRAQRWCAHWCKYRGRRSDSSR